MSMEIAKQVSLSAIFLKQTYESDDGLFKIYLVKAPYNESLYPDGFKNKDNSAQVEFFVKGSLTSCYPGQSIEIVGEWRYEAKYKNFSFCAQYLVESLPKGVSESVKFMKSRGVGETITKRVLEVYPSLENAAMDKNGLIASVKGMTKAKAEAICRSIRQVNSARELLKILKDEVNAEIIRKITLHYSENAIEVVQNEPYKMYFDNVVSFKDADTIALYVGWPSIDSTRIRTGIISTIRKMKALNGTIIVDKNKMLTNAVHILSINEAIIEDEIDKMRKDGELVSNKNNWYLKSDYQTEKKLADNILELVKSNVPQSDSQLYLSIFEKWKKNSPVTLAKNQEDAVMSVADNKLTVITGGPGTGKTATLKSILETYRAAFPKSNVTFMAPTGLAAKRMSSSCGIPAKTIHKTLNLFPSESDSGFDDNDSISIDGGLVIIDEFSMVGIHLANFLFEQIIFKNDTRVVIVGDIDQLPSVSAGSVLEDLIVCGQVKCTRLIKNFRQEAGSAIIDGAYAINEGRPDKLNFTGNFQFNKIENRDIDIETNQILHEVKKAFEDSIKTYGIENTYVLCPMRKKMLDSNRRITTKTLLSTSSLNPILRDIANPPSANLNFYRNFRENDRVINLKNNKEVMNGEIGYISKIEKIDGVPQITVNYDGLEFIYTSDCLKNIELAYAITVHKSQGCEYDSVIYPTSMTQNVMLQKNLLYTAVTRAKKSFIAIGSSKSICTAVKTVKNKERKDLLAARIHHLANK